MNGSEHYNGAKFRGACGNGTCVEVALLDDAVLLRDSKTSEGPVLVFTWTEWNAFVHGVKLGMFDKE